MDNFDIKKILDNFSDNQIDYINKNEGLNFTTYMLSKASSNFFVRVFDKQDDALPSISVQFYISDLPSGVEKNETFLAEVCNIVNYRMDNGTTTSYIKNHEDNTFFLVIKLGIPFIDDIFKTTSDVNRGENMLKMFLYTALIEITNTKGYLINTILVRDSKNEDA
ncbi:hypothetical protein D3C80_44330 [compost metagenome]